jgi:hypothetical protein
MGYKRATSIQPWKAYWVNVPRDTVLSLKQQYLFAAGTALARQADQQPLWEMRLSLSGSGVWDPDNYIGCTGPAAKTLVSQPEPPAAFGSTHLFFVRSGDASR